MNAPRIELRPVADLAHYARNARLHSDEQVAQLMGSLAEFGWTNPILADATGIIAGHGRAIAASRMYEQGKHILFPNGSRIPSGMVPVIDCTGWNEAQRRAYILADNRIAENAIWNMELVGIELQELAASGFDSAALGFSDDDASGALTAAADVSSEPAHDVNTCSKCGQRLPAET